MTDGGESTFSVLMIRRPPRPTRTDTLFPYTTPCRSQGKSRRGSTLGGQGPSLAHCERVECGSGNQDAAQHQPRLGLGVAGDEQGAGHRKYDDGEMHPVDPALAVFEDRKRRSDERRVGKEWVSTGRSRWSPYH